MNPHPKLERALAMIEFMISLVFAIIVGGACKDLFFTTPRHPQLEGEWSPIVLVVFTPLLVTMTAASLTMWYRMKYRWWVQTLPVIALFGIGLFLNQ